ncbi:type II toxin-antitoxin system RelE family toxin [Burkholderia cenocepacia]|uniref:type II toxin-antitoxin system RelE family toxin n=1 Tax=Burkholderia cenocepacia TaxID=95486 RepID=UPI001BA34C58|nr:type II toxin-antitoxin system RelE/ParE family toxin [Burkholderia cenocepacia]MBR8137199.1 hypothetical protein [Burkholderia cenocepacia]
MKLKISKQAYKALGKLDAKQFRQVMLAVLALTTNPMPNDSAPLKGAKNGERRKDVGEYRVIYATVGEDLEVLVIASRNDDDVYKVWERQK